MKPKDNTQEVDREEVILYQKVDAVAIVTLNRPHRYNAANTELVTALTETVGEVRDDQEIRAVVLTGAGKGFCAGADIGEIENFSPEALRFYITSLYGPLMRSLLTLRKPVIGAINGTAAGIGASIALACDLRIMSRESAILYAFINLGLGPDGGASWFLSRQVGYSRAYEIAISGKKISAEKCLELGLTNKLVGSEDLLASAIKWAGQLAQGPTIGLGVTKESLIYASSNSIYDTIAYEAEKQVSAFKSKDLKEGIRAFRNKERAKFSGE